MSDASDRSIPATAQRRRKAEEAGMLPKASLVAWCVSLAVVVAWLPTWSRAAGVSAVGMLREAIPAACRPASPFEPPVPWGLAAPLFGMLASAVFAALAVRILFERVRFDAARILPDAARVGPLRGLSRIAAACSPSRLAETILTFTVLATVAVFAASRLTARLADHAVSDPATAILAAWDSVWPLLAAAAAVAAFRWVVARWMFERRIRMTLQEYQDELRNLQAAPQVQLRRNELRRSTPRSAGAPDTRTDR